RGSSRPSHVNPSIVVTCLPWTSKARKLQELMGWPSTSTVQAPQTSDSHERFAPVRPSRARRKSRSTSSTGTSPCQRSPFTVQSKVTIARGSAMAVRSFCPGSLADGPGQQHAGDIGLVFGRAKQVVYRIELPAKVGAGVHHSPAGFGRREARKLGLQLRQPHGGWAHTTHR